MINLHIISYILNSKIFLIFFFSWRVIFIIEKIYYRTYIEYCNKQFQKFFSFCRKYASKKYWNVEIMSSENQML